MLHREAFCLMEYSSDDGLVKEYIWNSRDGVTPFLLKSKTGVRIFHTNWNNDYFDPNHVLKSGDRYFVDATEELVKDSLNKYMDEHCPTGLYDKNREESYQILLKDWIHDGSPWILEAE